MDGRIGAVVAAIASAMLAVWLAVPAAHAAAPAGELPKVLTLGSLAKVYEPVRFDHAAHVSMVGGCADCHHQHRSMQVQACRDCHRFDPAQFRKNLMVDRLLPCRDCHDPVERPGAGGVPSLKAAYHRACLKCHWGEVGSAGKNLENCTEMCHTPKAPGNPGGTK